jgi:hypothetical protein
LGRYLLVDPVFRRFELPAGPVCGASVQTRRSTPGYGPIAIDDLYDDQLDAEATRCFGTPEGSGLAATDNSVDVAVARRG